MARIMTPEELLMRRWMIVVLALGLLGGGILGWAGTRAQTAPTCGKGSVDKAFWASIKNNGFAVPSGSSPDALSGVLVGCLASPDPELRDALAFEIFSHWIRGGALGAAALRGLARTLGANLGRGLGETGTDSVLLRSFSALVLSEVMRQDARGAVLETAELEATLEQALAYLPGERDLRGYDQTLGWIHGVAHGSDLLWRLALNPRVGAAGLERILGALGAKVAPEGSHAYIANESDRLARAAAYTIAREAVPLERLKTWLAGIVSSAPFPDWGAAFGSTGGLARIHNTKAFLRALHSYLYLGGENGAYIKAFLPDLERALETMVGLI